MWVVSIVFCIFADGCYKVEDERGPYETQARCEERLAELSAVIINNVPNLIGMDVECRKEKYSLI
jgi:hypothetical protein